MIKVDCNFDLRKNKKKGNHLIENQGLLWKYFFVNFDIINS